jgi:hypothetical protein
MLKRYLILVIIVLTASAMAFAQGTFKPRDADEAEGWQIYNQYKTSVAAEARANSAIKQFRRDISEASFSTIGAFGSDPSDRARVTQLRQQINAETNRQAELLAKWESKFYWRYGDLRWSDEKIYDPKTKRQMDRIEFALIYFPFNYKPAVKPPAVVKPPVKPPVASTSIEGTYSGVLSGETKGSISFTVKGTNINGKLTGAFGSNAVAATFTGTVRNDGHTIDVSITGTVGGSPFTGGLFGQLSGGKGSGDWRGITPSRGTGSNSYYGYLGGDWTARH